MTEAALRHHLPKVRQIVRAVADGRRDLWDDLTQDALLYMQPLDLRGPALRVAVWRCVCRRLVEYMCEGMHGGAGAARRPTYAQARARQMVELQPWATYSTDHETPEMLAGRIEAIRRVREARRWLSPRERAIFDARLCAESPANLEDVELPREASSTGPVKKRVSRERVRQIEARTIARLRSVLRRGG